MNDLVVTNPDFFNGIKPTYLQLGVTESTFLKEVGFALQALRGNDYLAGCTPSSIQTAVYNTALTGLSLNPVLKFAALVPRKSGGNRIAVLEPMYQGLVKLVTDTGSVTNAYAYSVYEGDDFEVSYGTSVEITHKPQFKSKTIKCAYAVGVMPNGTKQIEVMSIEDIYAIREKSESYKAYLEKKRQGGTMPCFWVDHEDAMVRKTVLKRLCKYLPKSDTYEKLATAIDLDDQDYRITDRQQDYLLSLLSTSTYCGYDEEKIIESKIMSGLTPKEFDVLKNDLMENQKPSTNPSQKEIGSKVRDLVDRKNT
jgi:phage RecT family recombinase